MSDIDRYLANEAILGAGMAQQLADDALAEAHRARSSGRSAELTADTLKNSFATAKSLKRQAEERVAILENLLDQRDAALGKLMDAVKGEVFEKMSWMIAAGKLGQNQGKSEKEVAEIAVNATKYIKTNRQEEVDKKIEAIEEKAEITDEIKIGIERARQEEKGGHLDIARESKSKAGYVRALVNRATDQLQQKGSLTPEIAKDLEDAKQAAEKIEEMNTPKARPK
jgi:hypothetical protein